MWEPVDDHLVFDALEFGVASDHLACFHFGECGGETVGVADAASGFEASGSCSERATYVYDLDGEAIKSVYYPFGLSISVAAGNGG